MSTMNEVKPTELLAGYVTLHILTTLKDQNTNDGLVCMSLSPSLFLPLVFSPSACCPIKQ